MKNNFRKPELLAPAGNLETAVAAFNAGADAVYLGLGKFNARCRAENFKTGDLARLLDFAHKLKRKVYITLNTLITESELGDLMQLLAEISQLDVDAVIVQDLAVIYLIRKYFPHLTIHASTQMNIHNSCGIKAMELLGVKRVILERQLTLKELQNIARSTTMELEVFVHGSLCLSLSGRCLLSNYSENASGNRGKCRQLCRRNYRSSAESTPQAYLSPRDLELMQLLPDFAALGIASLKIEGRLRGPDYVVPVVEAYRQALDALPEKSPEALDKIKHTISRPSCSGTLFGFKNMLAPEMQAVFGRNVGVIKSISRSGLTVELTDRIHLGDKLRIVNQNNNSLAGFELTELYNKGNKVTLANARSLVTIPGKFPYAEGVLYLYKIGENGYDCKRQAAALPQALPSVKLALELDENGLHVTVPQLPDFEFHSESFAPAMRCSINQEDLESVFSSQGEQFRCVVESVAIKGQWFCAKSVLKNLRRELFTALLPHWQKHTPQENAASRAMLKFFRSIQQKPASVPPLPPEPEFLIPGFVAEEDLSNWYQQIRQAAQRGVKSFAVGGLHGVIMLKNALGSLKNISITGVYPLIACNSLTVKVLEQFKLNAVTPWAELPAAQIAALQENSSLPLAEQPQDIELLVTRLPLKNKTLIDKNGNTFRAVYDPAEKVTKIYGKTPAVEILRSNSDF